MPEVIKVPGSLMFPTQMSENIIAELVHKGELPADFYFRLLQFEDDEREGIATNTVLSKLGLARSAHPESVDYLTSVLPECVWLLSCDLKEIKSIIKQVDEDYHTLGALERLEENEGMPKGFSFRIWSQLVHLASPEISSRIQAIRDDKSTNRKRGDASKDYDYKRALRRAIIRDDIIKSVYDGSTDLIGKGVVSKRLLGRLLLDNHPELISDMDIT